MVKKTWSTLYFDTKRTQDRKSMGDELYRHNIFKRMVKNWFVAFVRKMEDNQFAGNFQNQSDIISKMQWLLKLEIIQEVMSSLQPLSLTSARKKYLHLTFLTPLRLGIFQFIISMKWDWWRDQIQLSHNFGSFHDPCQDFWTTWNHWVTNEVAISNDQMRTNYTKKIDTSSKIQP